MTGINRKTELPVSMGQTDDEIVQWHRLANRTQNPQRSVGGWLYVTNRRLAFHPHNSTPPSLVSSAGTPGNASRVRARRRSRCERSRPESCGIVFASMSTTGPSRLFVTNKLDAVIEKLRSYIT